MNCSRVQALPLGMCTTREKHIRADVHERLLTPCLMTDIKNLADKVLNLLLRKLNAQGRVTEALLWPVNCIRAI